MSDEAVPFRSLPFVRKVAERQRLEEMKRQNPDLLSPQERMAKKWFKRGVRSVGGLFKTGYDKAMEDRFDVPFEQ